MEHSRMQQIRSMLEKEPMDDFLNYALALEYEKDGQLLLAQSTIEALLSRNENYQGAYYKLGALYEKTGEQDKAILVYRKGMALSKASNNRRAYAELQEALQNLEV